MAITIAADLRTAVVEKRGMRKHTHTNKEGRKEETKKREGVREGRKKGGKEHGKRKGRKDR